MTKSASLVIPILAATVILSGGCLITSAQSAGAVSQHSMKGYELYSWQIRGEWHFTLFMGTNRLKSRSEVTSLKDRVRGVEALKRRLDRLGKGEEVFWSASSVHGTMLPPEEIIDDVKTHCDRRGVVLRVSRRGASGTPNKSPTKSPDKVPSTPHKTAHTRTLPAVDTRLTPAYLSRASTAFLAGETIRRPHVTQVSPLFTR